MSRSIYLINPASDFPTYFGAEVIAGSGLPAGAIMADLAILTLAAMVPNEFRIELCDELISPVNYECDADIVGITGKVNQARRMIAIAKEFRRRGKLVLMGGP